MEKWSSLKNGSALDYVDAIGSYQSNGCCLDIDHAVKDIVDDSDGCRGKLRRLFDQVLSVFLKQVASIGRFRPIPAMLGDGLSLDLFKLFWVVKESGGFDLVSRNGLWDLVVEELGLDCGFSSSVKLIYYKYLNEFETWLKVCYRDGKLRNEECELRGNFSLLSMELEKEFRGLLPEEADEDVKDNRIAQLEYKKNKYTGKENEENKLYPSNPKSRGRMHSGAVNRYSAGDKTNYDDKGKICDDDENDLVILDPGVAEKFFVPRKRKRECLSGMLKWVVQTAKYPDHPSIGVIPEPSKWKEHIGKEFWFQAIRAREALLWRSHVGSKPEESYLQNNQKMHPSMFEDSAVLGHHHVPERSRCSERLLTIVKPRTCSCCNPSTETQVKSVTTCTTSPKNSPKEQTPASTIASPSPTKTILSPSGDEPVRKHVVVGPLFQAQVPEWSAKVSDSDPKWLGTRIWQLYGDNCSKNETDTIGKGRPDSCGCWVPGSVKCNRFHIAEKRLKLKVELGSAFYRWKFDQMGEEVSLRWTFEEEVRFKDMVKLNPPSSGVRYWDNASRCFPGKMRVDLVSYYLNAFLIHRRSYQNRVTPTKIDSDDEESEFGSVSDGFGYEAVTVPGSNTLVCSQNNQYMDLE